MHISLIREVGDDPRPYGSDSVVAQFIGRGRPDKSGNYKNWQWRSFIGASVGDSSKGGDLFAAEKKRLLQARR